MQRLSDTNANPPLSAGVLERLLHVTDIMVVLTDPDQEDNPIVWVNDYFCEFTGYARADVLGRNCRFLQGTDRDQPGRRVIRRAVGAGEDVHVLLRNYKADGTPFDNDLYVSPVREDPSDPESPVLYYAGVQNNATDRVTAEAEAEASAREAHEAAENERERFGMDIHDGLGQELAGISLLAKSLHDRLEAEGSPLSREAGRIFDLVGGALDSARAMARGLNPVDDSAGGLVHALRELCETTDRASSALTVRANVEPVLFADPRVSRHLYRIAQEALSNAVKHAAASEVVVTLHRSPAPDGEETAHLEVDDDGVGIDGARRRPSTLSGAGRHGRERDAVPGQPRRRGPRGPGAARGRDGRPVRRPRRRAGRGGACREGRERPLART